MTQNSRQGGSVSVLTTSARSHIRVIAARMAKAKIMQPILYNKSHPQPTSQLATMSCNGHLV